MRNRKISYLDLCKFLEKHKNKQGIVRLIDVKNCEIFNIPKNKEIFSWSSAGNFFFGFKVSMCSIINNKFLKI